MSSAQLSRPASLGRRAIIHARVLLGFGLLALSATMVTTIWWMGGGPGANTDNTSAAVPADPLPDPGGNSQVNVPRPTRDPTPVENFERFARLDVLPPLNARLDLGGPIADIAYAVEASVAAVLLNDRRTIRLIDLVDGTELATHPAEASPVHLAAGATTIVYHDPASNTFTILDARTGTPISTFANPCGTPLAGMAMAGWSDNVALVAVGPHRQRNVMFLNLRTERMVWHRPSFPSEESPLSCDPSLTSFAAGEHTWMLHGDGLWNVLALNQPTAYAAGPLLLGCDGGSHRLNPTRLLQPPDPQQVLTFEKADPARLALPTMCPGVHLLLNADGRVHLAAPDEPGFRYDLTSIPEMNQDIFGLLSGNHVSHLPHPNTQNLLEIPVRKRFFVDPLRGRLAQVTFDNRQLRISGFDLAQALAEQSPDALIAIHPFIQLAELGVEQRIPLPMLSMRQDIITRRIEEPIDGVRISLEGDLLVHIPEADPIPRVVRITHERSDGTSAYSHVLVVPAVQVDRILHPLARMKGMEIDDRWLPGPGTVVQVAQVDATHFVAATTNPHGLVVFNLMERRIVGWHALTGPPILLRAGSGICAYRQALGHPIQVLGIPDLQLISSIKPEVGHEEPSDVQIAGSAEPQVFVLNKGKYDGGAYTIRIWSAQTGTEVDTIHVAKQDSRGRHLRVAPAGDQIALKDGASPVRMFERQDGTWHLRLALGADNDANRPDLRDFRDIMRSIDRATSLRRSHKPWPDDRLWHRTFFTRCGSDSLLLTMRRDTPGIDSSPPRLVFCHLADGSEAASWGRLMEDPDNLSRHDVRSPYPAASIPAYADVTTGRGFLIPARGIVFRDRVGPTRSFPLLITSTPPAWFEPGTAWTYIPETTARPDAAIRWSVADAPADLTLDERTGALAWNPRDKGTSTTFTLKVSSDASAHSQTITLEARPSFLADNADWPRTGGHLILPDTTATLGGGYPGEAFIIHAQSITTAPILDPAPARTLAIGSPITTAISRNESLLVVTDQELQVYSIRHAGIQRRHPLNPFQVHSIIPVPDRQQSWLTISQPVGSRGYRYGAAVLDEDSGVITAVPRLFGIDFATSSNGEFLFSGVRNVGHQGVDTIVDEFGRLFTIGGADQMSLLLRYEIGDDGSMRLTRVNDRLGSQGRLVAASAAGDRVGALIPDRNRAEAGGLLAVTMDGRDLTGNPTPFPTEGPPRGMIIHPVLPLVVVWDSRRITVFRDLGGPAIDADLMAAYDVGSLKEVVLDPTGRTLLVHAYRGQLQRDYSVVIQVDLPLKAEELAKLQQRPPAPPTRPAPTALPAATDPRAAPATAPSPPTPKPAPAVVIIGKRPQLGDFTALQPKPGAHLETQRIAEINQDGVVQISTSTGEGTGFVIGPRGMILTCAHLIKGSDPISVRIRAPEGRSTSMPAKVIATDAARNLALIQTHAASINSLVFTKQNHVAIDQKVFAFGSPDLALVHGTVTDPDQRDDGWRCYLTTLILKAECSGGPLLDETGQVIGMLDSRRGPGVPASAIHHSELQRFLLDIAEP